MLVLFCLATAACIRIGDPIQEMPSDFTQQPISTQVLNPMAALTGTPVVLDTSTSGEIQLTNNSDWHICYVYIAPPSQDTWGHDLLEKNEEIALGASRTISFQAGIYDMRAENCDYMVLNEQYNVDVNGTYSWDVQNPTSIYFDDFTQGITNWQAPVNSVGKAAIVDEALELSASQKELLAFERFPQPVQDSIMVVEVHQDQAAIGSSAFGMMCWVQSNGDGYLFLLRSDQKAGIFKVKSQEMIPLADWQSTTDASYDPALNILQTTCNQGKLALRMNGLTVINVEDSEFSQGDFGLAVVNYGDGAISYKFDNLAVINP